MNGIAGARHAGFLPKREAQPHEIWLPAGCDVFADAHQVDDPDRTAEGAATAQQGSVWAGLLADCLQPCAQNLGAGTGRVSMFSGEGCRVQKIQLQVGEAPFTDRLTDHSARVFQRFGVGQVKSGGERVPAKASIHRPAAPIAQQPLGVPFDDGRVALQDERGQPDARGEAGLADFSRELAKPMREALIEFKPIADTLLVAIVNLKQVERQFACMGGHFLQVGSEHTLIDFGEVLVPGTPAEGRLRRDARVVFARSCLQIDGERSGRSQVGKPNHRPITDQLRAGGQQHAICIGPHLHLGRMGQLGGQRTKLFFL